MKILTENTEYVIKAEDTDIVHSLDSMLPLEMRMQRSAGHEYYASLPKGLKATGAKSTSHVKAGGVYYFEDWEAFALNFKDMDISPYKVYIIGEMDAALTETLKKSGSTIEVVVKE